MIEYYFIDHEFLKQYTAQNKSKYIDRIGWKLKVSLLGQGVELGDTKDKDNFARSLDIIEEIKKKNEVITNRLGYPFGHTDAHFYKEERINASYGTYQNDTLKSLNIDFLKIWLSEDQSFVDDTRTNNRTGHVNLLLIECQTIYDGKPTLYSGFSALNLLFQELASDLDQPKFSLSGGHLGNNTIAKASQDLREALIDLGVTFSEQRKIETLYRVRASCMERGYNAVIGYPIYIGRCV